jgi:hypothetical protein
MLESMVEPPGELDMDEPPDELEDATLNTGSDLAVGCDFAG